MIRRKNGGWALIPVLMLLSVAVLPASTRARAPQRTPDELGRVTTTPIEPIGDQIQRGQSPTKPSPSPPATTGQYVVVPEVSGPVGLPELEPLGELPTPTPPAPERLGWFARRRAAPLTAGQAGPRGAVERGANQARGIKPQPPGPSGALLAAPIVSSGRSQESASDVPIAQTGEPTARGDLVPGRVAGRPAPFVNQEPTGPRRQALAPVAEDPDATLMGGTPATIGRPAPNHTSVPQRPRSSRSAEASPPSRLRPQLESPGASSPGPPGPGPAIPASLPDLSAEAIASPSLPAPTTIPAPAATQPLAPTSAPMGRVDGLGGTGEPAPTDLPTIEPPPAIDLFEPLPPEAQGQSPGQPPSTVPGGLPPPGSVPEGFPAEVLPSSLAPSVPLTVASPPVEVPGVVVDPAVRRTATTDETSVRAESRVRAEPRPFASACAARVGDSIITVNQVKSMVMEKFQQVTEGQLLSDQDRDDALNMLGQQALDYLIEQELILLEARHKIKDPKFKAQFDDMANRNWTEKELPPLLRKYNATNEFELKQKLATVNKSYADLKNHFTDQMLMHQFLYTQIRSKVPQDPAHVELWEARKYYNDNLARFQQPASISWREVEVDVTKHADREAARRVAEGLRARLIRGEDFAAVARSSSDGPTASRGGLFADKTPGDYGITSVNEVLGTIPTGQVSPVIEARSSFHIVRVESRREAGPRSFPEVQQEVRQAVFNNSFDRARAAYIAKLRAETLVRISPIFQQAPAPGGASTDPAVRAASNR